jgi:hypothetical protein
MAMAKVQFYGDVELARIKPMIPQWHPWYIYSSDNSITWHAHPNDSDGPVLHADGPDGLVARIHEFDLSEGR